MKTQAISKGLAEIIYKPEQAVIVIIQTATKSQPLSYLVPLHSQLFGPPKLIVSLFIYLAKILVSMAYMMLVINFQIFVDGFGFGLVFCVCFVAVVVSQMESHLASLKLNMPMRLVSGHLPSARNEYMNYHAWLQSQCLNLYSNNFRKELTVLGIQ